MSQTSSSSSSLAPLTEGQHDSSCGTGTASVKDEGGSSSRTYCGTSHGKIITVHSALMVAAVCLAGGMLSLSRDTSQLVFSLVMCCIATVMLLLWLSMCCRSYRVYRAGRKSASPQQLAGTAGAGKPDSAGAVREV